MRSIGLLLFLVSSMVGTGAHGAFDYTLSFTADGTPPVSAFTGNVGDTIQIPVYLFETGTNTGTQGFADGLQLYGAVFQVNLSSQSLSSATGNNPLNGGVSGNLAGFSTSFSGAGVASSVAGTGRSALIGTVNVELTTVGVSTIQLAENTTLSNEATLGLSGGSPNVSIDVSNFSSASISAVPEPSSIAVLGLTCVGLVMRRRRA